MLAVLRVAPFRFAVFGLSVAGCGDSMSSDGPPVGLDDVGLPDGSSRDSGVDEPRDAASGDVPSFWDADFEPDALDAEPTPLPSSCPQALPWDPSLPLVDTTTRALDIERLSCAGVGAGARSREAWWRITLADPRRVRLTLGTAGFDAVLAARSPSCDREGESCRDRPPVLEIPRADQSMFVGVEGFSGGEGGYVVRAETSPPLVVPAPNASCAVAEALGTETSLFGHGYGGSALDDPDCPMADAVFYRLDRTDSSTVSVVVSPLAAQDLVLAVLDDCQGRVVACADARGHEGRETIGPLGLPPGTAIVAVGRAPGLGGHAGSFDLRVSDEAQCRTSADCPSGEWCSAALRCEVLPEGAVMRADPVRVRDLGLVDLELPMVHPVRPGRVFVRVRLAHSAPSDLVMTLKAPSDIRPPISVRLRDRTGSDLDVVYGLERPADGPGRLEDFGLLPTASGSWTLVVEDRMRGDEGDVLGVALWIEP